METIESLTELVISVRGNLKSDLANYERMLLRRRGPGVYSEAITREANKLQAALDRIDALIVHT